MGGEWCAAVQNGSERRKHRASDSDAASSGCRSPSAMQIVSSPVQQDSEVCQEGAAGPTPLQQSATSSFVRHISALNPARSSLFSSFRDRHGTGKEGKRGKQ